MWFPSGSVTVNVFTASVDDRSLVSTPFATACLRSRRCRRRRSCRSRRLPFWPVRSPGRRGFCFGNAACDEGTRRGSRAPRERVSHEDRKGLGGAVGARARGHRLSDPRDVVFSTSQISVLGPGCRRKGYGYEATTQLAGCC